MRLHRFAPVALAAALLLARPAGAQQLDELVPASPTPAGFVADVAGVLSPDQLESINARIHAHQAAGRGDIAVAILPSIGGYEPHEVGVAIYREWKVGSVAEIGSARRDLGALLLVVPKERAPDNRGHCWITTGRGAEGPLTDAAVGEICRDLVIPRLRERQYGEGVLAFVGGIESLLAEDSALAATGSRRAVGALDDGASQRRSSRFGPLGWIGGAIGALVTLIGGIFGIRRMRRNRPRRCPRCGTTMRRLDEAADDAHLEHGQRVEERVKSVDYDVWECPSCGAHLPARYPKWITSYSKCPGCASRTARTRRRELVAATTSTTGLAEDTTTCEACGYRNVEEVILPVITSSSSGSGSSGGGSSGGSSFGGSGATSGGGAGSSY